VVNPGERSSGDPASGHRGARREEVHRQRSHSQESAGDNVETPSLGWAERYAQAPWRSGEHDDRGVLGTGPPGSPGDADTEILETAHDLRRLSGRPVTIVTGDTGMALRAETEGIPSVAMPEDLFARLTRARLATAAVVPTPL
jgi:hypothetical protein